MFFSSITLQDLELFQEDIAWIGFLLIVCIHDAHLEEFAVCSSAFVCVLPQNISGFLTEVDGSLYILLSH